MIRASVSALISVFAVLTLSMPARAEGVGLLAEPSWADQQIADRPLLAQFESDDSYDPFADYSEFDAASDEEADINFFRNGRFFTLGFIGGYRTLTDTLGDIYAPTFTFGLFLSYFFDLRFAMQLAFVTGDHTIDFTSPAGTRVRGTASITSMGFDLKYYLNTQNVTRGLAKLNPYLIGGFSQVYRTSTVTGQSAFAKEGALGFNMGAGVEVPMLRNKMFLGFQGAYHLISFRDENSEINLAGGEKTGIFPTGDYLTFLVIMGINF
ncbi:MAG: outer membrane beta-barrel protein [Bdellovibrionales bacterium]|nr:outer membrane beta-barrel protein [Bdellovibrionales bacterium]